MYKKILDTRLKILLKFQILTRPLARLSSKFVDQKTLIYQYKSRYHKILPSVVRLRSDKYPHYLHLSFYKEFILVRSLYSNVYLSTAKHLKNIRNFRSFFATFYEKIDGNLSTLHAAICIYLLSLQKYIIDYSQTYIDVKSQQKRWDTHDEVEFFSELSDQGVELIEIENMLRNKFFVSNFEKAVQAITEHKKVTSSKELEVIRRRALQGHSSAMLLLTTIYQEKSALTRRNLREYYEKYYKDIPHSNTDIEILVKYDQKIAKMLYCSSVWLKAYQSKNIKPEYISLDSNGKVTLSLNKQMRDTFNTLLTYDEVFASQNQLFYYFLKYQT